MKLESRLLRILLRIVAIGILSVGLTLLVYRAHIDPPTLGLVAAARLPDDARSVDAVLGTTVVVDLLVAFGFLFGVWFLWTQGRNLGREEGTFNA